MIRQIVYELKEHAPFTAFGAVTGVAIMAVVVFCKISRDIVFSTFSTSFTWY